MSDILDDLRRWAASDVAEADDYRRAADEIERLRKALTEIIECPHGKGDGSGQDYIDDILDTAREALRARV